MSLLLKDLIAELKNSLHDSASVFKAPDDGDFQRFLRNALPDMGWKRPITRVGQVSLLLGVRRFQIMEADFLRYKTDFWWDSDAPCLRPWETNWPGPAPRTSCNFDAPNWYIDFETAPTVAALAAFGSAFKFWYFAQHLLSDTAGVTTVRDSDSGLLVLRAQAEAMRELAVRNAGKPVQLRDGLSGAPRNSTPSALHETLMHAFRSAP